jgi:hypothetical protein
MAEPGWVTRFMDEAAALGDFKTPGGWLAHYTKAKWAFEDIVPGRRLLMNPYRRMNDPVENKHIPVAPDYGDGPPKRHIGRLLESEFQGVRDGMRLVSLTRDVDGTSDDNPLFNCCWGRPRMWHQYGDKHEGVCLVFDRASFENAVRRSLHALGETEPQMGCVDYTTAGIFDCDAARTVADERVLSEDPEARKAALAEHIRRHSRELFFLKTTDWESEYEYRVLFTSSGDEAAYVDFGDALRFVIAGDQFPAWQDLGAAKVCADHGVQLWKMMWDALEPNALPVEPPD